MDGDAGDAKGRGTMVTEAPPRPKPEAWVRQGVESLREAERHMDEAVRRFADALAAGTPPDERRDVLEYTLQLPKDEARVIADAWEGTQACDFPAKDRFGHGGIRVFVSLAVAWREHIRDTILQLGDLFAEDGTPIGRRSADGSEARP